MKTNVLYYGDKLGILRRETVDLLKGKRPRTAWRGSPCVKTPTEKEKAEQEAIL